MMGAAAKPLVKTLEELKQHLTDSLSNTKVFRRILRLFYSSLTHRRNLEGPAKRCMGVILSQLVDYNPDDKNQGFKRNCGNLGGKTQIVSVQNERKLWILSWAGSRLRNNSTRNRSHFLQKRKEVSEHRTRGHTKS